MKNKTPTFSTVFEAWFAHYEQTVKKRTSEQTYWLIANKVNPVLGRMPIDSITPKAVLDLCNAVAQQSPYNSRMIAINLNRIFDYAVVVMNIMPYNKLSKINSYLPKRKVAGMKFVDTDELPEFFLDIALNTTCHDVIKRAFFVLIYTALRRQEVAYAKKSEFDLQARIWTVPAERLKISDNGRHIVPLSNQVIELITPLFDSDSDYLFSLPNNPSKPINAWSINQVIRQSGWQGKQTLHGFRKIFSTHAHASRKWTIDAIELSLAHRIGGVRGIYNHADMLDERVELMAWWADEVDGWRV